MSVQVKLKMAKNVVFILATLLPTQLSLKTQLLWLEMALFSKKALHNIEKHNSAKTYGILLK